MVKIPKTYYRIDGYSPNIFGNINNRSQLRLYNINDKYTDSYIILDENLNLNNITIQPTDNVYFSKECKYPRSKFSENCTNKKVIKKEKADIIVINNIGQVISSSDVYVAIDDEVIFSITSIRTLFTSWDEYNKAFGSLSINDRKDKAVNLLKSKGYINESNIINYNVYYLNSSGGTHDEMEFICSNIDKCITTKQLDEYLSKNQINMDNESFESIDKLLKSSDKPSVELGVRLLNNYNISENIYKIGLLLKKNSQNIIRNKVSTSVGFKNILNVIGMNLSSIENLDNLRYLSRLYKISTNTEDKTIIKSIVIDELEGKFNENSKNLLELVTNIPITYSGVKFE